MFTASKVAQMAAVFARNAGGTVNVLKLTKLLYLADRESMERYGYPISYDFKVSMPHGPVLSRTLNLTNGDATASDVAAWDSWIASRENHDVSLKRNFKRDDLKELSNADLDVLEAVWKRFGGMSKYALRDWTHKNCPEWTDPEGSCLSIDEETVLRSLGKSEADAKALAADIDIEHTLDRVTART